jgi:glycosyltransferase involved in cell wall biosynthesis
MRLAVVIPAYNEEATIAEVIRGALEVNLKNLGIEKEILVVNDGSTDRTPEIVKKDFPQAILINQVFRQGKGSAIVKALVYSQADMLIIQDADLEYDPKDYPFLLEPILKGRAEVVYGSRFLGYRYPLGMRFLNYLGNLLGRLLVNLLYGARITDLMTGYKVLPCQLLRDFHLRRSGFDICAEITAKLLKKKINIYEVPISYQGRGFSQGKKIGLKDSLFILSALLEYRFRN